MLYTSWCDKGNYTRRDRYAIVVMSEYCIFFILNNMPH